MSNRYPETPECLIKVRDHRFHQCVVYRKWTIAIAVWLPLLDPFNDEILHIAGQVKAQKDLCGRNIFVLWDIPESDKRQILPVISIPDVVRLEFFDQKA